MGRDNQDYFKRGGRSVGPPGPLRQFRDQLGQQQAELHRGGERGFPGSKRQAAPPPAPPREEEERRRAEAANGGSELETGSAEEQAELETRSPEEHDGAASPPDRPYPAGEEHAGSPASEASFGPPASEEYAEGRRDGRQRTNGGASSLPAPMARVVRRFPRLSHAFATAAKAQARQSQRLAGLGERIESTLGSGRR